MKFDRNHVRNIRVHIQSLLDQNMSVTKIGELTGMRRLAMKRIGDLEIDA